MARVRSLDAGQHAAAPRRRSPHAPAGSELPDQVVAVYRSPRDSLTARSQIGTEIMRIDEVASRSGGRRVSTGCVRSPPPLTRDRLAGTVSGTASRGLAFAV